MIANLTLYKSTYYQIPGTYYQIPTNVLSDTKARTIGYQNRSFFIGKRASAN